MIEKYKFSLARLPQFVSLPRFDDTITANRVKRWVVLVEDKISDRALMRLEWILHFISFNVDEFDFSVGATDGYLLASFVKFTAVCYRIASVDIYHFLYHPDVPYFDDTIGVTRTDVLPSDGEGTVINCV